MGESMDMEMEVEAGDPKEMALAKLKEADALCEKAGLSLSDLVQEFESGDEDVAEDAAEPEMEGDEPEAETKDEGAVADEDKEKRKALMVAALRKKAG